MPDLPSQVLQSTCHDFIFSQHSSPKRIISLVPSQTELLADLGLDEAVIGITKFCIHPEKWFKTKTRIGGTKQLNLQLIRQLEPDLILANKEENLREQILELEMDFPVWVTDVNDIPSSYEMIHMTGELTGKKEAALSIIEKIQQSFNTLPAISKPLNAAYLIWREPYMIAGGDTFISAMMEKAGFRNLFADKNRYPQISIDELASAEVILLSSEPYPFKEKHVEELQRFVPSVPIMLVDGEMFSWYGSRMLLAAEYFKSLSVV